MIANLGFDPVELPTRWDRLLAVEPLGRTLPTDTTVWLVLTDQYVDDAQRSRRRPFQCSRWSPVVRRSAGSCAPARRRSTNRAQASRAIQAPAASSHGLDVHQPSSPSNQPSGEQTQVDAGGPIRRMSRAWSIRPSTTRACFTRISAEYGSGADQDQWQLDPGSHLQCPAVEG